eukprot:14511203-Ditylum_brightwellii.AAC.1
MLQDKYEMEMFLQQKSPVYIRQWLNIWQSYFRKGVKLSAQQVIANVRPFTQYFVQASTCTNHYYSEDTTQDMTELIMTDTRIGFRQQLLCTMLDYKYRKAKSDK